MLDKTKFTRRDVCAFYSFYLKEIKWHVILLNNKVKSPIRYPELLTLPTDLLACTALLSVALSSYLQWLILFYFILFFQLDYFKTYRNSKLLRAHSTMNQLWGNLKWNVSELLKHENMIIYYSVGIAKYRGNIMAEFGYKPDSVFLLLLTKNFHLKFPVTCKPSFESL